MSSSIARSPRALVDGMTTRLDRVTTGGGADTGGEGEFAMDTGDCGNDECGTDDCDIED